MKKYFYFSIYIIWAILLPKYVFADTGPKPTVDITVSYNQQSITDKSFQARMLACFSTKPVPNKLPTITSTGTIDPQLDIFEKETNLYDSSKKCYWYPAAFAWTSDCADSSCHFWYAPPNEFKFAVFIPSLNKMFVTNEISRTNFNSTYKAELFSNASSTIRETTPIFSSSKLLSFRDALLITLSLELLVTLIFISVKKLPRKILWCVLLVNIISLPIVWFIFPLLRLSSIMVITLSEIFAFLFETYLIYFLCKKLISLRQSFVLNLLNNITSLFIGGFIFIVLTEVL